VISVQMLLETAVEDLRQLGFPKKAQTCIVAREQDAVAPDAQETRRLLLDEVKQMRWIGTLGHCFFYRVLRSISRESWRAGLERGRRHSR
jgi:hypothetical protein